MKQGQGTKKRFVAVFFLLGLLLCCASAEAAVTLSGYDIGAQKYEYVLFGRYPQTEDPQNAGQYLTQPILWRVLSSGQVAGTGGTEPRALVLTEKLLECVKFNSSNYIWNNSNLQRWLNSDAANGFQTGGGDGPTEAIDGFLHTDNFADNEYAALASDVNITTMAINGIGNQVGTEAIAPYRVFALSYEDLLNPGYGFVAHSSSASSREALVTGYAVSHGAQKEAGLDDRGIYWTRGP